MPSCSRINPSYNYILSAHRGPVTGLSVTHDRKYLVTSSSDGTACIYAINPTDNVNPPRFLTRLTGVHSRGLNNIAVNHFNFFTFPPSRKDVISEYADYCVTAGDDGAILWNMSSERCICKLHCSAALNRLVATPSMSHMDRMKRSAELEALSNTSLNPQWVTSCDMYDNFVVCGTATEMLFVFNLDNLPLSAINSGPSSQTPPQRKAQQGQFAACENIIGEDGVHVLLPTTIFAGHQGPVLDCRFLRTQSTSEALSDQLLVVSASSDANIKFWSLAKNICLHSVNLAAPVTHIVPSMNGKMLLASVVGCGSLLLKIPPALLNISNSGNKNSKSGSVIDQTQDAILREFSRHSSKKYLLSADLCCINRIGYVVCGSDSGKIYLYNPSSRTKDQNGGKTQQCIPEVKVDIPEVGKGVISVTSNYFAEGSQESGISTIYAGGEKGKIAVITITDADQPPSSTSSTFVPPIGENTEK